MLEFYSWSWGESWQKARGHDEGEEEAEEGELRRSFEVKVFYVEFPGERSFWDSPATHKQFTESEASQGLIHLSAYRKATFIE